MQKIRTKETEQDWRLSLTDTDTHNVIDLNVHKPDGWLTIGLEHRSLLDGTDTDIQIVGVDNVSQFVHWAGKVASSVDPETAKDDESRLQRYGRNAQQRAAHVVCGLLMEEASVAKYFPNVESIADLDDAVYEAAKYRRDDQEMWLRDGEFAARSYDYKSDVVTIQELVRGAPVRLGQPFLPVAEWLVRAAAETPPRKSFYGTN